MKRGFSPIKEYLCLIAMVSTSVEIIMALIFAIVRPPYFQDFSPISVEDLRVGDRSC